MLTLPAQRTTAQQTMSSGSVKKVSPEPGDSAWDALKRVAEMSGLWPWMAPDGTLIIGGPDYSATPVDTLIHAP
ncbi:hypothetical protein WKI72_12895 [Candidatus Erwinia dacicola]|uniref:Baseplate hub protein gp44/GpP-like second domain-containing protein n=1 Tax=Candidatus Erwinia dacicola TaxID=252393 RepID=A0A328T9G9_9GAMM|nr:hypothetical protein ACZ87_04057 [Candidatus Erwinia dacicola]